MFFARAIGKAFQELLLNMDSQRRICVHCERYMTMVEAAEFFSSFGEVAALEISRQPSTIVYVRFFEDGSADLLLDLIAKDLHARVKSESRESPYIRPGTIITAWDVSLGFAKEFRGAFTPSPFPPTLTPSPLLPLLTPVAASPSLSTSVPHDRLQVDSSDSRRVGQAETAGYQDTMMALGESSDNPGSSHPSCEVILERVINREDRRTTIMVRNLPKKGKSSDFIEALKVMDIWNSLTFYYMPFDKSRNRFCGFAFLDFRDPVGILRFSHAKFSDKVLPNGPVGISYAHIQGLPTIRANFSDSMIMEELDETRRPMFLL